MNQASGFRQRGAGSEVSSADLLRECGRRLTDAALWQTFQERFHRQITLYVMRTIWRLNAQGKVDLICDLVQDVYLRLRISTERLHEWARDERLSRRNRLFGACLPGEDSHGGCFGSLSGSASWKKTNR